MRSTGFRSVFPAAWKPATMPLALVSLLFLSAPAYSDTLASSVKVSHEAMHTEFVFTLYGDPDTLPGPALKRLAEEAFTLIDDLESRISRWRPDSQVSALNHRASREPVKVSPDLFALLQRCAELHSATGGAFDVTVGPLLQAWKQATDAGRIPTTTEREAALGITGFPLVVLDDAARTVAFTCEGVSLDFGGIGKGLALDLAAEHLKAGGVRSALLHAGSSTIVAIGAPPESKGWTVQIEDPYNVGSQIGEVSIADASLSTSGSYRRFYEAEGKRFSHIIDPRTGMPAEGIAGASAIAPNGVLSDALSTAFFVMGIEGTVEYCQRNQEYGAVLVPLAEDHAPEPVYVNIGQHQE